MRRDSAAFDRPTIAHRAPGYMVTQQRAYTSPIWYTQE